MSVKNVYNSIRDLPKFFVIEKKGIIEDKESLEVLVKESGVTGVSLNQVFPLNYELHYNYSFKNLFESDGLNTRLKVGGKNFYGFSESLKK